MDFISDCTKQDNNVQCKCGLLTKTIAISKHGMSQDIKTINLQSNTPNMYCLR